MLGFGVLWGLVAFCDGSRWSASSTHERVVGRAAKGLPDFLPGVSCVHHDHRWKNPSLPVLLSVSRAFGAESRPNILFIMSDDHAAHAISAYGSMINQTPNIDRLAKEGIRFNHCFAVNSICAQAGGDSHR